MSSRRLFLKIASLGVFLPSSILKEIIHEKKDSKIGIQLYSVRDEMAKDPIETLRKIALIGYKNVEHAGYSNRKFYGFKANEFKKILNDVGLRMPSGHISFGLKDWDSKKNDFTDLWKNTVEDAVIAGQEFLITPWMDEKVRTDYDLLSRLMDLFNRCGEYCNARGITFGYHNHEFEFNTQLNNSRLFDLIMEKCDPKMVIFQLDMGNMFNGGGEAISELKRYPGRFRLLHVKDEIRSDKGELGGNFESCIIGEGVLPVLEVIHMAKREDRIDYYIIEQESYQGKKPLECIEADFNFLNRQRL